MLLTIRSMLAKEVEKENAKKAVQDSGDEDTDSTAPDAGDEDWKHVQHILA